MKGYLRELSILIEEFGRLVTSEWLEFFLDKGIFNSRKNSWSLLLFYFLSRAWRCRLWASLRLW
jgi:hypothetical protein